MDRTEAYGILIEEMKALAQTIRRSPEGLHQSPVERDVWGTTGALYRMALTVEPISPERFAVVGTVHDNGTYRFDLLEERLQFDRRDGE